ncbi:MAG: transglutaminase family protein [Ferruginibacter sp.]|nr:transglutaminase family protein [Ferruginibacter sp.]
MKFNIFSELSYEVFSPTTFIFNVQAARSPNQSIIEETLLVTPGLNFEEFTLNNVDARFIRMEVGTGIYFTITYYALVDVQYRIIDEKALAQSIPIIQLNTEVLPYLFPSRHCQSDKLRKLATKEFGHLQNTYTKVLAINNWIFNNTDYITGATDSGTSAYDTLIQREGVCKDFAHLGIAMCRASDIPARYFTGYACNLNPPDFHACFEAYIAGQWIFFDPTKLVPINGLVKIANSKDAGDAAVASFFGNTNCTYMNVQCSAADTGFKPFNAATGKKGALSYQ